MVGVQIKSSLITILRISPVKSALKRLPLILSRELLTLLYIIAIGVKKAAKKFLMK